MSFRIRNQVQLVGRLSDQLALQRLSDDHLMLNTQLIIDDALPAHEEACGRLFHLVSWNGVASSMHRNLEAGQRVIIQGRLVNKQQQKAGVKYYRTEVHVSDFMLLQEPDTPVYGTKSSRKQKRLTAL